MKKSICALLTVSLFVLVVFSSAKVPWDCAEALAKGGMVVFVCAAVMMLIVGVVSVAEVWRRKMMLYRLHRKSCDFVVVSCVVRLVVVLAIFVGLYWLVQDIQSAKDLICAQLLITLGYYHLEKMLSIFKEQVSCSNEKLFEEIAKLDAYLDEQNN